MRERGWRRVVNVGSRAATTPLPNMVEYSAAKAAVVNMTTSLARHLAGSGITANTVSPGVIVTDGMRQMFEDGAAARGWPERWAELEPLVVAEYAPNPTGRLGTGTDIAAAVAFLASRWPATSTESICGSTGASRWCRSGHPGPAGATAEYSRRRPEKTVFFTSANAR
nr:SDR family oxidoreductase [Streptomyces sabulosicollis]